MLNDDDTPAQDPLDEAITPISGAHSVPVTARPHAKTAAVRKSNWQGAGPVIAFAVLFIIVLVIFMLWRGANTGANTETTNQAAPNQP